MRGRNTKGTTTTSMAAVVVAGSFLASMAHADPQVFCQGSVCTGGGQRRYAYPLDATGVPIMEFRVGTNDLEIANYTDVLTPAGWQFVVEPMGMTHSHWIFAPHGQVTSPCWCLTRGRARWWTDNAALAVEQFTFGYDHSSRPETVGWILTATPEGTPPVSDTFYTDWLAPVGTGAGPLHAPVVPEPATLTILLTGTLAVIRSIDRGFPLGRYII